MKKNQRQHKECVGCSDHFTTFRHYDYCINCAVNGSRYLNKNSPCSECDGSGIIKFPKQKPRPCKLCALTKKTMPNIKKSTKLTAEEKYWKEVDRLSQEKIYQLFTINIPFQNIPLITEPWKYEEAQQKKVGLFLDRDVDYRTLLVDLESQYYERSYEDGEELPSVEAVAEEVTVSYCQLVIKSLIRDLSEYPCYDPSFFENLDN